MKKIYPDPDPEVIAALAAQQIQLANVVDQIREQEVALAEEATERFTEIERLVCEREAIKAKIVEIDQANKDKTRPGRDRVILDLGKAGMLSIIESEAVEVVSEKSARFSAMAMGKFKTIMKKRTVYEVRKRVILKHPALVDNSTVIDVVDTTNYTFITPALAASKEKAPDYLRLRDKKKRPKKSS